MNIVSAVILCTIVGAIGAVVLVLAAAITSLSFMGFGGIVENLFNVTL